MGYQQLNTQTGALQEADESPRAKRKSRSGEARNWLNRPVSDSVLKLVPAAIAHEKLIMPLAYDGETLILASPRADDIALADHLRFLLGRNVRLVQADEQQIREAFLRHYGKQSRERAHQFANQTTRAYGGGTFVANSVVDLSAADDMLMEAAPASAGLGAFGSRGNLGRGMTEYKRGVAHDLDEPTRGEDQTHFRGVRSMFTYTIDEGQQVLVRDATGKMKIVVGPQRVWSWWRSFLPMKHFVAHPGQFLVIRFRNGRQQHLPGPAEVWFDPREHLEITLEDALRLSGKEAVVVYSQRKDTGAIARRIEYGPAVFVPQPGEWLHEFQWHASQGGHKGAEKIPRALVFQKLWLMPDQMYHDVHDVRTSDDAVLTIRLMLFFELVDIERMLDTTHDPIGDFINAATSDVVDFTGRYDFDAFKQNTEKLNELDTYKQLQSRAAQCGYRINKVVYRGYGAPDSLQKMHNEAIEARTRLVLQLATEQQAQDVENYKLDGQLARAAKRRGEQKSEVEHELDLSSKKNAADISERQRQQEFTRRQREADAQVEVQMQEERDAEQRRHYESLKSMGVDLTRFLTQGRADRVIELRGGNGAHVHLAAEENGK